MQETNSTIWRQGATPEELDLVKKWDIQLADLAERRADILNRRSRLVNRACSRQRYRMRQEPREQDQ